MRPRLGPLPKNSAGYRFELKYDGYRAMVEIFRGELVGMWSKSGRSMLGKYPAVQTLPASLRRRSALLDAELVGFDEGGRPRFHRTQLGQNVALFVFDVLGIGSQLIINQRYDERRRRLEAMAISGERWHTVDVFDDGLALLKETADRGLEGVVSKLRTSSYEPGRESGAWIKTKNRRQATFIVGGWLPSTVDSGAVGSLLVGQVDERGRLVYRGSVAGFDRAAEAAMRGAFLPALQEENPFAVGKLPRASRFLLPRISVDVTFQEITNDGQLRHPQFVGFRLAALAR